VAPALARSERRGGVSDHTPIHELSPEQATARLAEMQRAYDARTASPAPPDKPSTAAEAKARLDHLVRDGEWSKKLDAGDADTHKEFHALTALAADLPPADRLDAALRGEVNPGLIETTDADNPLTTRKLASTVEELREVGLSDDAIREAIHGGSNTAAIHRAVGELKAKLFGDQEWVKKYLAGGAAERKQATLIAIILSGEVAA
jgi:hypothetical protein